MARSLNRAQLIGNLTRDPELRYTPNGKGVCSFGIATNRYWTTESGERKEEADFHNIVAWGKLAELCSQFLVKGRKVFIEGRMQTRSWTGQDGATKSRTEIVIDDMILLDSKGIASKQNVDEAMVIEKDQKSVKASPKQKKTEEETMKSKDQEEVPAPKDDKDEEVSPDDIPF